MGSGQTPIFQYQRAGDADDCRDCSPPQAISSRRDARSCGKLCGWCHNCASRGSSVGEDVRALATAITRVYVRRFPGHAQCIQHNPLIRVFISV